MQDIKAIKKIDIHAHATLFPQFFPPFVGKKRFISPEEVIAVYDEIGVEKGVLLPISSPEGQPTPMTSEACKYISDKYPDRFLWFGNVDPRATANNPRADLKGIIEFYKSLGAKGVGEITARIAADDPRLHNLFAACESCEMPAIFHIAQDFNTSYGIVDELGLPRIEGILKKHPKLKLIGHSQAFWSEISADNTEETRGGYPKGKVKDGRIAQLMRRYENFYCDLSAGSGANALMRDKEYAVSFLEEFSDRILYGIDMCTVGSDVPYLLGNFLLELLDEGLLRPATYKKIVRDNAVKLLNIQEEGQ